jgi:hypothetical protein
MHDEMAIQLVSTKSVTALQIKNPCVHKNRLKHGLNIFCDLAIKKIHANYICL